MRIIAIIAVRNGAEYVQTCLDHLISNGIEVAVLDQMSEDGTYEHCLSYKGNGLCHLSRFDYPGYFSLQDQLIEKQKLISELDANWIIHQDIDELLESPEPLITLSEAISEVDRAGYDAINFNEFIFIPHVSEGESFFRSRYYYFFDLEQGKPRLIRSWKKALNLSNVKSAGHKLDGFINLFPISLNLRHYPFINQTHAFEKYPNRIFSDKELKELGWHWNRINVAREAYRFPDKQQLQCLPSWNSRQFDLSKAHNSHYWEWL